MKSQLRSGMRAAFVMGTFLGLFVTSPARAQETKEKITINNVDRTYTVRLPTGFDKAQKYPVVILLHGMNQDADDMERLTRFDELADKDSIIAVYPSALQGRWNIGVAAPQQPPMRGPGRGRRGWGGYPGGGYPGGGPGGGYPGGGYPGGGRGYPGGQSGGQGRGERQNTTAPADDIDFLNEMLDQMATKFPIDKARVYVAGLSDGGFMAMKAGCAMADRIAAIAPVGATMPKTMVCLPSRPLPVVMINGTSDPIVPYDGGTEHNLRLPTLSAEDSAKAWAKLNRCSEKPTQTKVSPQQKGGMETKIQTYSGCQQDGQVVLYSLKGGGNTWPGGEQYEVEKQIGKTSQDLKANETMWSFFVTKKLPTNGGTEPNSAQNK